MSFFFSISIFASIASIASIASTHQLTRCKPQLDNHRRHVTSCQITMDDLIVDPNDGAQLARPARAARMLGMTSRQVYRWIADGKVRVRYAVGGAVLVEVASLFTQQKPTTARVGKYAQGGDLQPAA